MDYHKIIHQPDYSRENLGEEDLRFVSFIEDLADEVLSDLMPDEIDAWADSNTKIRNLQRKIILNVFYKMRNLLDLKIAEIQIAMEKSGDQSAIARDELPPCENSSGGEDYRRWYEIIEDN